MHMGPLDTSLWQTEALTLVTNNRHTYTHAEFPEILEPLNKSKRTFLNVEGRTTQKFRGNSRSSRFLSTGTKYEFCVTWFVCVFTIGKLKGWKEKRAQFWKKGIFWCFPVFSMGKCSYEPPPLLSLGPPALTDRFTRADTCKSKQTH